MLEHVSVMEYAEVCFVMSWVIIDFTIDLSHNRQQAIMLLIAYLSPSFISIST